MKIYTKTGDDGTSGLIGGTRVNKSDERLEAYGTVDELNSWIGVVGTTFHDEETYHTLAFIQNSLFTIASNLATDESIPGNVKKVSITSDATSRLESEIDRMQSLLPPISRFVLPGGSTASGYAHVARTVCRRAERRIDLLKNRIILEPEMVVFINRLSDYLFVLSRFINYQSGNSEAFWNSGNS